MTIAPETTERRWLTSYGDVPAELPTASGSLVEAFQEVVRRAPDATLVRYFDTAISAAEIDRISDGLAVAFQDRGVSPGDRIGMYLQNVPQTMITMLAAWKAGAVIVPCNPMLKGRELVKILSDAGAMALVLHDDLYIDIAAGVLDQTGVEFVVTTSALDFLPDDASFANLKGATRNRHKGTEDLLLLAESAAGRKPETVALSSDDVAFMVYTSGTTGAPKGAMNTHGNAFFAASLYQHWQKLVADTIILGLAPLFHVTGLSGHLVLSMITGAQLLLFYRFDADIACALTERYRATFTVTAVTAFTALLGSDAIEKYDLSSLTTVYTGGAPTPTTIIDRWQEVTGSKMHPMYGLTEVTSPATMTPLGADYRSDPASGVVSIGVPLPNTMIRIVTDEGTEAKPREVGELRITGPQVVPGYWQMPDETAAAFEDGELRTGDIGFMDEDGWVYLVDRAKDMIVASGFKVWPSEVEEVLYQHPAVREAGVIGVPDEYRGENVKAYVSLKPGEEVSSEEIKAFARDRLAAYKYPRIVEIIDDLPKNTSGKIMRRLLQQLGTEQKQETVVETLSVSYPEARAAIEARTVLQIGSTWLRLSQGGVTPREAAQLYQNLHDLIVTVGDGETVPETAPFLAANEVFHKGIVDLLGNEHIAKGYDSLKTEELFATALEGTVRRTDQVVNLHEQLTDSIAAGNALGARSAILAWSQQSHETIRSGLGAPEETGGSAVASALLPVIEHEAPQIDDFAESVDALLIALEARAAMEIGVTQLLVDAETTLPERKRFVARLKAAIPLVRGSDSAHAARYARADDAFHRTILSLLNNEPLMEIYNRIDIPELMYRILEVTPVTVRDALDNYQALTAALLEDEAAAACTAIASHMNDVRSALTRAVAAEREAQRMEKV